MKRYICILLALLLGTTACLAQSERKSVRRGNRDFRKEQWQQAEINYKKALVADSTSVSADYNLGNTYYRMENYPESDRYFKAGVDSLAKGPHGADAFHNMGNSQAKQRSWQAAVESYKNALRRNPDDMETKANLAYAQKMLENEQQNGGGGGNDQNQNQDQNQDQNNDQNQDQNQDQNNQDQNNDQNQDNQDQNDQNQDQNQNNQNDQDQQQNQDQQQGQQPKITPQSAQQMLQAIQAQEKDTQDKVKKEKAARLKSKQKEKNW